MFKLRYSLLITVGIEQLQFQSHAVETLGTIFQNVFHKTLARTRRTAEQRLCAFVETLIT